MQTQEQLWWAEWLKWAWILVFVGILLRNASIALVLPPMSTRFYQQQQNLQKTRDPHNDTRKAFLNHTWLKYKLVITYTTTQKNYLDGGCTLIRVHKRLPFLKHLSDAVTSPSNLRKTKCYADLITLKVFSPLPACRFKFSSNWRFPPRCHHMVQWTDHQ